MVTLIGILIMGVMIYIEWEIFDFLFGLIGAIAAPLLAFFGLLIVIFCAMNAWDTYSHRDSVIRHLFSDFTYKSLLPDLYGIIFGLVLVGIWFFNIGGMIVDAIFFLIALIIVVGLFAAGWSAGGSSDSLLMKFASSIIFVATGLVLIFFILPFIPIGGALERSTAAGVIETVPKIERNVAARIGSFAQKDGKRAALAVEDTAMKAKNKIFGTEAQSVEKASASTGLSVENKIRAYDETGWSFAIIDNIRSLDELSIYKGAGLRAAEKKGKLYLTKEIDWSMKDFSGRTNLERTQAGLAPIDEDGKPLELHHIGQKPDSPLAELTRDEHRGKGNDAILHDKTKPSEIDRQEFGAEQDRYWKERAAEAAAE